MHRVWSLTAVLVAGILLLGGLAFTSGEHATAGAAPLVFSAALSGPGDGPPNDSPGTGNAVITFDPSAHTLAVQASFNGLLAGTTASHIHACTAAPCDGTADVATQTPTFGGFPLGVTGGTYARTF